jgi:hypothetical protein
VTFIHRSAKKDVHVYTQFVCFVIQLHYILESYYNSSVSTWRVWGTWSFFGSKTIQSESMSHDFSEHVTELQPQSISHGCCLFEDRYNEFSEKPPMSDSWIIRKFWNINWQWLVIIIIIMAVINNRHNPLYQQTAQLALSVMAMHRSTLESIEWRRLPGCSARCNCAPSKIKAGECIALSGIW